MTQLLFEVIVNEQFPSCGFSHENLAFYLGSWLAAIGCSQHISTNKKQKLKLNIS
ncbi:MAG: hypothetical protein ACR9NN_09335 [Nostochopsis sp.]